MTGTQTRKPPERGKTEPILLGNNWSLRRAGLKGFRVEASFDGEALCLAGRRRGTLRIPPGEIERLLVGYEKHKIGCTWRTMIWSTLTRRGLVLATNRFDPGFSRLVEKIGSAMVREGRLDRIETGQRMADALVLPVIAIVVLGLVVGGLWLDPVGGVPPQGDSLKIALGILAVALLLVWIAFQDFFKVSRPRPVKALSDIYAYLPGF